MCPGFHVPPLASAAIAAYRRAAQDYDPKRPSAHLPCGAVKIVVGIRTNEPYAE